MIEPIAVAEERIRRTSYGPISSIKRLVEKHPRG
jgi:hypothetical protein